MPPLLPKAWRAATRRGRSNGRSLGRLSRKGLSGTAFGLEGTLLLRERALGELWNSGVLNSESQLRETLSCVADPRWGLYVGVDVTGYVWSRLTLGREIGLILRR